MKILVPVFAVALIATGCVSATHVRETVEFRPGPNGTVVKTTQTEKTSLHSKFSGTALKGFTEITFDGSGTNRYSRTVKVQDTSTDISSQLAPIIDSAIQAAVAAAAKAAKP